MRRQKPGVARSVDFAMATSTASLPSRLDAPADPGRRRAAAAWLHVLGRRHSPPSDPPRRPARGQADRVPAGLPPARLQPLPLAAGKAVAAGARAPPRASFPESASRRLYEPLRLRRTDSTRIAAIERSCARYERSVRAAAEEFGLQRPAVITAHPLIAGFGHFDWAGPVTYYANDDLTAHPPLSPWWPAYEVSFARMREAGRRAVGLTPKSLQSVDPSGPGAVIPTGLIPAEWNDPAPAPGWFLELPGPRMVYVGTLDERIDPAAVRSPRRGAPRGLRGPDRSRR